MTVLTPTVAGHLCAVDALPTFAIPEWRGELLRRIEGGARPVILFGTAETEKAGADVVVTAVLEEGPGRFYVARTTVTREHGYHTLSERVPALNIFERELHEQFGIRIAGHPWLKPLRGTQHGHASLEAMQAYRYHSIEGKEVHEVAVGPIHAGVIEPGSFRFMCLGEQVHHLEIQLGYQHRGVEALLLKTAPHRLGPLVESIAGDTSIAHAWAWASALERLEEEYTGLTNDAARGILLELERVGMHLAGLSGLAADVGFLQGATTYGRLRTTAINASMLLCGSRFGRGGIVPGRTRARFTAESLEKLRAAAVLMQTDLELIHERFLSSRTVQSRFRGVGELSRAAALELGVVGMVARSSGVWLDQRAGGLYRKHAIDVRVEDGGDCWARTALRVAELKVSLAWILDVTAALARELEELGGHGRPQAVAPGPLPPSHFVLSVVEGWRGEVVHCLETDAAGKLRRYKVQDPSLRNWMGLAIALRGNEISDFPICNKSFDLSYCGSDL